MTRDHRMTARRVAAAFLVLLLVGCASTTTPSVLTPSSSPSAVAVVPSAAPSTVMPPSTATVSCVDGTLASMSEAQRIGQVFMIGLVKDRLDATERAAVADFHFGSFAFTTQSTAGVKAIRAITDAVQGLASGRRRLGWVFVAANQEGGLIQGLAGPGFDIIPPALTQGAMSAATLRNDAARWGRELGQAASTSISHRSPTWYARCRCVERSDRQLHASTATVRPPP